MINKGMIIFLVIFFISAMIASSWDKYPLIKDSVGAVLNPTLGVLLNWNIWVGFIVVIALTSLVLTLAQKYLSDQKALKEMKKEQKYLQEEMKKYSQHPEKLLELQKKQLEFFPKTFDLTMKPLLFTSIPIVLLFRWFNDILAPKLGGWWIFYYLIGSIIFSGLFRKWFDVA